MGRELGWQVRASCFHKVDALMLGALTHYFDRRVYWWRFLAWIRVPPGAE